MGTGCQNGGKVQITTISPPIWPLSSVALLWELGGYMGEKPKLHPFYPPITMGPSRTVLLAPEGRQGGAKKSEI